MGQMATPANERRYSNEHLASVFEKTEAIARCMDEHAKVGAWFAGPPGEFVAYLKSVELRVPGLEYVHVSNSMGTPQSVMLEQLAWFAKEVKPAFTR
jgi:hypothetical protein